MGELRRLFRVKETKYHRRTQDQMKGSGGFSCGYELEE